MSWPEPLWVFGYGSLCWKVGFRFVERVEGHVEGYARRFCQGSEDHRGVPGTPGRVVTLVKKTGERVWGVAYRIAAEHADEVMAQLDYREKGGYSTLTLPVMPRHGGKPVRALVYIGTRDNPHFIQDEPLLDTARVIAHTVGPSGPNREYMLNLAEAMRLIAPEHADEHLEELEEAVVVELGDAAGAQALTAAKAAVAQAVADAIMAVESAVIAQKAEQIATATIEAALATAN